jgi:hypothetical protein
MREPLLHFVLLGGLLFAVDAIVAGRADDPHTIVVSAAVDNQAKELFKAQRGHEPNAAELAALRHVWLDNEVLYREGLAMQMDKGDDAIRERVIFKALSVVDANVKLPQIDAKHLREWFESHRDKYDEPARYDFQDAALVGDSSEAAVRTFVDSLNAGTPGDAQAGLRVFKSRPRNSLAQSYGAEFAKELDESPVGVWRATHTKEGWRAIRLDAIAPPKPADFERLRGVVYQDWKDEVAAEQRSAAVRALAKKYTIRYESDEASRASGAAGSASAAASSSASTSASTSAGAPTAVLPARDPE